MPPTIAPPGTPEAPSSWARDWRGAAALILLALLALLPGLRDLPPVDRDESRFAQASRQMLDSDSLAGWIVPRIGDRPRLNKPPLIYWLQAASAATLGSTDPDAARNSIGLRTGDVWVYRIPSLIAAIIAALFTWRLGLSMFPRDPRVGWLAGVMLLCSVIVLWDARQARADQLLLAVTTAAMWTLWKCWVRHHPHHRPEAGTVLAPIALWLLVAIGILSKGPITPMVVAVTAFALAAATRSWRWLLSLKPFLGVLIIAIVIAPWVVLVAREVGWSNYLTIIYDETLGRSVSSAEGHWGPPGYHLVLLPVMFWPGSMLTAAGIVLAWRTAAPTRRLHFSTQHSPELFLLAWLIPSWIVFELISTKLPHYTMPLYPALALLSARAVFIAAESLGSVDALGLRRVPARIGLAIWCLIGLVFAVPGAVVMALSADMVATTLSRTALGGAVILGVSVVVSAARSLSRHRYLHAQALTIAAAIIASSAVFGVILPRLRPMWISPRLVASIESIDPAHERPLAAIGYHEDSLTFLTNTRVQRIRFDALAEWLVAHPRGVFILPEERLADAEQRLSRPVGVLARERGFNYSKGAWVNLVVAE